MRVVMATNQFPKFSETFLVRQFSGLLHRGWDVHVVCPTSDPAQWEFYPELRDRPGVRERVHPTRDFDGAIAELRPDLVHFEFGAVAVGRTHIGQQYGCTMLVTFRGYDLNFFRAEDPHCYDDVWQHADAVHCVSTDLWRRAQRRGCPATKRNEVIFDAVDVDDFTPEGREYAAAAVGTPDRPLRILSVGRLHWKKGYEFGLEAVRLLVDQGVQCEYRIVGDGEHREPVVYTIEDLGLRDVVRLEGARPKGYVRQALLWADVLLHNAVSEGFCVSALEAQATGLPVVATDADGLPENVLDGRTGLIVRRRDASAAMQALLRLARDPALRRRLGEAGPVRAAKLTYDDQLDRYESLYRCLISDRRVPSITADAAPVSAGNGEAERVRAALAQAVAPGATVLVVSRGDDSLVEFPGWRASHFPQAHGGGYAGFYPADSGEAIQHLEDLRSAGAEYLVFPPTATWWLEHYTGLRMHLESAYGMLQPAAEGGCVVVALAGAAAKVGAGAR
jgi:colanic acid/amylovoran biosynthesis glycosyltransferase